LQAVGLDNWALAEWGGATKRLPPEQLKVAAALAMQEGWNDRAIYALGSSGELQFYDWRFPILWRERVEAEATRHDIDPAWVLGVMRSESAMTEAARSSAGALGLMQVLPTTARQISKQHGLAYKGQSQLLDGDENIRFGAVYLRELLDRFGQNPVLVSGAYNAGPNAVNRWLASRKLDDPQVWVETLPYYETRDYIPRVLAFTTIYDWRLHNTVRRVSSRMPRIESGTIANVVTTEVVCQAPSLASN
jgi:soluble lytic murein transglycosylase